MFLYPRTETPTIQTSRRINCELSQSWPEEHFVPSSFITNRYCVLNSYLGPSIVSDTALSALSLLSGLVSYFQGASEKTNAHRRKVNITLQPTVWLLGSNWDLSDFKFSAPSTLKTFANQRINEYFRVPCKMRDLSCQLFLIIVPNENMNY